VTSQEIQRKLNLFDARPGGISATDFLLGEIAFQLAVQNESRDVSKEVLEKIHQISGEVDAMQVDIRKLTKALLLTLKAVKAELGTQDASSPKTEPGTPEVTKK
jgi:hypothetical protein